MDVFLNLARDGRLDVVAGLAIGRFDLAILSFLKKRLAPCFCLHALHICAQIALHIFICGVSVTFRAID